MFLSEDKLSINVDKKAENSEPQMIQKEAIKRVANGSIDTDHYLQLSYTLRSEAFLEYIKKFFKRV